MNQAKLLGATLAVLLFAGGGAAFAAAQDSAASENQAASAMTVSLPQAIQTAEQQTGGKAFDAGVDENNGRPEITIETTGPKGVQTVMIDGMTGKVTSQHAGSEQD